MSTRDVVNDSVNFCTTRDCLITFAACSFSATVPVFNNLIGSCCNALTGKFKLFAILCVASIGSEPFFTKDATSVLKGVTTISPSTPVVVASITPSKISPVDTSVPPFTETIFVSVSVGT